MAMAINKALGDEAVGLGVLKALADNSFDSVLITEVLSLRVLLPPNAHLDDLTLRF
ncbi:MAG: hypothetical protein ACI9DC_003340 [Gammaproteobacteria bacterium]|jgi:hypothetical protein